MASLLSLHGLAAQSLALAACTATLSWSQVSSAATEEDAHAESSRESVLQPGWSVALLAGYEASATSEPAASGSLGPGVGLRARYTAPFGLLGGVRLVHHFGAADSTPDNTMGLLEVGWAFPVGPLRLELFVGGGLSRSTNSTELCNAITGQCETSQHSDPMGLGLSLGTSLAYPLHERFFVFGEVEAVLALGPIQGVAGYGGVGATF